MNDAFSDKRNAAAFATSSAFPIRIRGYCLLRIFLFSPLFKSCFSNKGVSMSAGQITFTLILYTDNSSASDFENAVTAPFVAPYKEH